MSEKLAKSAEKGEIYAFVAGEPDNADDVSESATVSKYWLGEILAPVNVAQKDMLPEHGTPIACGERYARVKWIDCVDSTNLRPFQG